MKSVFESRELLIFKKKLQIATLLIMLFIPFLLVKVDYLSTSHQLLLFMIVGLVGLQTTVYYVASLVLSTKNCQWVENSHQRDKIDIICFMKIALVLCFSLSLPLSFLFFNSVILALFILCLSLIGWCLSSLMVNNELDRIRLVTHFCNI